MNRRLATNYCLYNGELLRNGVVEVDSSGKILSVSSVESLDSLPYTEFFSGIMMPAMVNAHCHLELSYLRGAITEQCGFASFAQQMAAVRKSFTASDVERAIARADIELYNGGVGAVGDISNSSDSFEVKRRSRVHYHTFVEHFGLGRSTCEHLESLLAMENSSLTPHSTYSVLEVPMRYIAEQGEAPLSIHFMETESEMELFQGCGAMHDWYESMGFECDFLHYESPAERLVRCVPPSRSVILVHNTAVREEDIDLIMNHFTAPVYWVVCPRSNRYISGAEPPVEMLARKGLNICIGTDSLASNHSLSMVEELAAMPSVPLATRLDWATRVGALALGLEDMGEIEVGRRPGLVVMSGVDVSRGVISDKCKINRLI